MACSEAPQGRSFWTLSLLVEQLVELGIVGKGSKETVRCALKKTKLKI